jgi:hypothetical protein
MMVGGVHAGSHGPIFHSPTELAKSAPAWNGIPVVIQHPQANGNFISAKSPGIEATWVGIVYNAKMKGNKLVADVYLDEAQTNTISPEAFTCISTASPMDVSIGSFCTETKTEAQMEWNGETYSVMASNYVPDHLALLPGSEGACSWADGCGIRTNAAAEKFRKSFEDLGEIQVNQMGYQDLIGRMHALFDSMDSPYQREQQINRKLYYLEEAYQNELIYRVRITSPTDSLEYFKQGYGIASDGKVELVGDPIPVKKELTYTVINVNKKVEIMAEEKKSPCCLKTIDNLIANADTKFEESNREWLTNQSEEMINSLVPKEKTPEEIPAEIPAENKKEEKKAPKTLEAYIAEAPVEIQETLQAGVRAQTAHRSTLVANIMANAVEGSWTAEELESEKIEMLEKLSASFKGASVANYAGQNFGASAQVNTNSVEAMYPEGVE